MFTLLPGMLRDQGIMLETVVLDTRLTISEFEKENGHAKPMMICNEPAVFE